MRNKKGIFIISAVAIFLAIIVFTWLCFEKAVLYFEINSPLPKKWASFQLSNGEVVYGRLAGTIGPFIAVKDAAFLERFSPAPSFNPVSTSTSFSISDSLGAVPETKLVPVPLKSAGLFIINRQSVIYWNFLEPDDPAISYLE